MSKKERLVILALVAVAWAVGMSYLLKMDLFRQEYNKFEDRGVPRINIELSGVELEEINEGSKDARYGGNELTIYNSFATNSYQDVEIKGRGNGTWAREKKPYRIKFKDKVDLFGMGKSKKWCLLANAVDGSNLRNETAFNIAEMLGMEYAMSGEYVELYVNGGYRGLYYLTHAVEIGKSTVDLKDQLGIIVELDNLYWAVEDYRDSGNGDKMVKKDVKVDEMSEIAMDTFMEAYNKFELAVKDQDYEAIKEIVDTDSLVEYFLLSEFSVNPDAYWTSFYYYMDGKNDKIHAGPAWDYDLAFGNRRWANWLGEVFYSPTETMVRKQELLDENKHRVDGSENMYYSEELISRIIYDLVEIPEFMDDVKRIFREKMSGRKDELIKKIRAVDEKIEEAALKNDTIWNTTDYRNETERLIEWVEARYDYFEQEYGEPKLSEGILR